MSNYTQTTNFATKDALASGNPLKVVKGTEINVEFVNIATAIATKTDIGILGADQGGTGVANNAAMTVTGSGNFAYTRTLTAATNVTFPTAGTLSTLAGSETFTNKTLTSPVIGGTPTGVGVLTSGTLVASTSGTSIDFTSIPSWVKRITVMFNEVSTNGTSEIILQTGDSGGIETSGYIGATAQIANASATSVSNFSTGIRTDGATSAAAIRSGAITISLINQSSNLWAFAGCIGRSDTTISSFLGGTKALTATLDRVRITTILGVDTFDAGSVNILFE